MLPLRNEIPTRRFPVVTLVLIAANVSVYLYQLTLNDYQYNAMVFKWAYVPVEYTNSCRSTPANWQCPMVLRSFPACSCMADSCISPATCSISGYSGTMSRITSARSNSSSSTLFRVLRRWLFLPSLPPSRKFRWSALPAPSPAFWALTWRSIPALGSSRWCFLDSSSRPCACRRRYLARFLVCPAIALRVAVVAWWLAGGWGCLVCPCRRICLRLFLFQTDSQKVIAGYYR